MLNGLLLSTVFGWLTVVNLGCITFDTNVKGRCVTSSESEYPKLKAKYSGVRLVRGFTEKHQLHQWCEYFCPEHKRWEVHDKVQNVSDGWTVQDLGWVNGGFQYNEHWREV